MRRGLMRRWRQKLLDDDGAEDDWDLWETTEMGKLALRVCAIGMEIGR